MRIRGLSYSAAVGAAFAVLFCSAFQAQSQDVAEAARQAKLKKQQKAQDPGKPAAKPKTYSNDDLPESNSSSPDSSAEKNRTATPSLTSTDPNQSKTQAANNTATVKVQAPKSPIKHPGASPPVEWSMQNTSDHTVRVTLAFTVTGPCKYRYQDSKSFDLNGGSGLTDNTLAFAVYEDSCPGTYNIELRVSAYGTVLATDSASATVI